MTDTRTPKLRFADAVYAIDTTPKALRLWLQRGLVKIHSTPPEGRWLDYTYLDIAILALTRKMVDCGLSVERASEFANRAIARFPDITTEENARSGVLAYAWDILRLRIFNKRGDQWDMQVLPLVVSNMPKEKEFTASEFIQFIRTEFEPADVFLTVNVAAVLRTAFARARESASGGEIEPSATEDEQLHAALIE